MLLKPLLTLALLLPALAFPAIPDREDFPVADVPPGRPAPAFSSGTRIGSAFYIAGHIGRDAATQRAPSEPEAETRLLMTAVQRTLDRAHLTWDDVVSVTVYCTDLSLYDRFNSVYRTYFHGHYPTRTFVGVKDLLVGAHFEINGIAFVPPGKRRADSHVR